MRSSCPRGRHDIENNRSDLGRLVARVRGLEHTLGSGLGLRFDVLGPLRVTDGDRDVTPRGRVARTLLALLLVRANQPVRPEVLGDVLWPDSPDPGRVLHPAVHRLRKSLDDPGRLVLDERGYRLRVEDGESDLATFDRLTEELMVRPHTAQLARDALALWRGDPLEGLDAVPFETEIRAWTQRRQVVEDMLFEAEVEAGRSRAVLPEIEAAASRRPLDERIQSTLVRALHATGRQADALAAYSRTAATLREELGLDPGQELRDLQASILAGDAPAAGASAPVVGPAPAQLPPGTDIVGRDPQLAEIDKLIGDGAGICVLTGTAGVGKTALAVRWARARRASFPDGQMFIDLRGFSEDDPMSAAEAVAAFLRGLGTRPDQVPADLDERSALLRSHLADRQVLLVLDNAASAAHVRPLLPGTGTGCAVLVTSRESLPGLGVNEGARGIEVGRLDQRACVALLAERAGDRIHHEAHAVDELIDRCARLPLALRIAAEQIRARPDRLIGDLVADLVDEGDRLDLLGLGDGSSNDLRAVLSWSYESLPDDVARVFRLLGLVRGPDIDLYAVAALCSITTREARRATDRLVRAHLLDVGPGGRFSQHDLLRAYAAEGAALLDSDEAVRSARARLLGYYVTAAARASDTMQPGRPPIEAPTIDAELPDLTGQPAAAAWMSADRNNAVAAARAQPDAPSALLVPLARALYMFLFDTPHVAESLLRTAHAAARSAGDNYAVALVDGALGILHGHLADLEPAVAHLERARDGFARCGDDLRRIGAEANLAAVAARRGDLRSAIRGTDTCVDFYRRHLAQERTCLELTNLAESLLHLGRLTESRSCVEEAAQLADSSGDPVCRCVALCMLSRCRTAEGRAAAAMTAAQEALALARSHHPAGLSIAFHARGRAHLCAGRTAAASSDFTAALRHGRQSNDALDVCWSLDGLATAVLQDEPSRAAHYFQLAADHAARHGFLLHEAAAYVGLASAYASSGDTRAEAEAFSRARTIFGRLDLTR